MEKRSWNPKNAQGVEDWIGQLPVDIVGSILSHLTLKEAVRTSLISKRWKDVWTLTPHFDFDFSKRVDFRMIRPLASFVRDDTTRFAIMDRRRVAIKDERGKYIKWVNQLVDNHQGTYITEFVVVFPLGKRDSAHLDKWIEFGLRKRVKELKIHLFDKCDSYSFPKTALAIAGIESLTSLCLFAVNITGEMVEQFLSICPLLERLSLRKSYQTWTLRIVGSSLKLKYLNIKDCSPLENMHVCVPNLESFHFCNWMTSFQVEGLGRLIDLDIHVSGSTLSYEITKFSSYFPQLETFSMSKDFAEIYFEQPRSFQFTKLRHLIVLAYLPHLTISTLYDFIILSCPNLHKLTVDKSLTINLHQDDVEWGDRLSHQHLKVVELIMFAGINYNEIKLVKWFLKAAINLEKLIIDTRHHFPYKLDPDDGQHDEFMPGARNRAEEVRKMLHPGVELLII